MEIKEYLIGKTDCACGKPHLCPIDDALLYAKDLKDRYSVLWMYYDLCH